MSNNDLSESSSADCSVAEWKSQRGAEPIATLIIICTIPSTAGGRARGDTSEIRETIFCEDASGNVGVTGGRGAAVPVGVLFPQQGVSQISHGGLDNGGHTPAVSWE